MSSRRTFITGLIALPPAFALSPLWAAEPDGAKQALVFGNGAYDGMELPNPPNDAKAMTSLLTEAGFTIDSRINASRAQMLEAIDRFARVIRQPGTKVAVFYYAGHGVQLDWRNYLVPVDAIVDKRSDIQARCADLNAFLGQLAEIKDKTFIVILDACRDDPFGNRYKPEARGLSQFDAPVGSLLGYATAPGKVASDGSGKNGLYTENLVRELSQRAGRLEDALKRVRLNVRLASSGAQIPWETTSLESDVFLFGRAGAKLDAAELESALEQEIEDWSRIKSSTRADDWIAYLRKYPNGKFAEVAQHRLDRLLPPPPQAAPAVAEPAAKPAAAAKTPSPSPQQEPAAPVQRIEIQPSAPSTPPKPVAQASAAPVSAGEPIRLAPGLPVPKIWTPSQNPYSAGRYHNGRIFTVGDKALIQIFDIHTNLLVRELPILVTKVDLDADLVVFNDGVAKTDTLGNYIALRDKEFRVPHVDTPVEFQVGKRWTSANEVTVNGSVTLMTYEFHMSRVEQVTVPAGTFDAFRVDAVGRLTHQQMRYDETIWLVPGIDHPVRRDKILRNERGQLRMNERFELVRLFQQRTGVTS